MKNGWPMYEIDRMDMLGYLRVMAWSKRRKTGAGAKPKECYIDDLL